MSLRFVPIAIRVVLGLCLVFAPGVLPAAPQAQAPTPTPRSAAPSMAAIAFKSHGAILNGLIYRAGGAGPHPVALFLHGFPGVEKNLDLAQAVRRAGWDVIYFDYRGNWGSGGTFSFAGSLEDVTTILAWIRAPENAAEHHFDPERLAHHRAQLRRLAGPLVGPATAARRLRGRDGGVERRLSGGASP